MLGTKRLQTEVSVGRWLGGSENLAEYGRWRGNKNKHRHLLQLSQHQLVLRLSRALTSPLLMMSPPVSRTPHLRGLSIIHIVIFFSWLCPGWMPVILLPQPSPHWIPLDTCAFTVPEILQLSYRKRPLEQQTLWSERAQSPVEKIHQALATLTCMFL